ncbi:uncharacterized protein LOC111633358 [Centruroides sculpturatus]|uniref:uncharacterized protein LOC111633358 n=1 Tax=Centruroides sculpturatus TaxID=218467 RepID=UPI000C6ED8F6|nr:uncharacterized protein LOC111633358 [Centruroides sculpturatus]
MMPTGFLLLLFTGVALAYSPFQTNQYMDTVLHTNLPNAGLRSNIDPAILNNFQLQRNVEYFKGNMTGLFRGRRAGDCSPIYRDRYGNATLNCTIQFGDIKFRFQGKLTEGRTTTLFSATATMSPGYAYVEVTSRYNFNSPSMRTMHLTQNGKFSVALRGLDRASRKLIKLAKDGFIQRISSEFFNVFQHNYVPAMGTACARTRMPI